MYMPRGRPSSGSSISAEQQSRNHDDRHDKPIFAPVLEVPAKCQNQKTRNEGHQDDFPHSGDKHNEQAEQTHCGCGEILFLQH
jgi:hypothetical protein